MRRPPVIYRPDPMPTAEPKPQPPSEIVLAGKLHRAHRLERNGHNVPGRWVLECSGRTIRSPHTGATADDLVRFPNLACVRCWGER